MDTLTFRLAAGAGEAGFLEADARVQAELSSREGFLRRTTARSAAAAGEWLVVTLWWSEEAADAGAAADGLGLLGAYVDPPSVQRKRYLTLD